MKNYLYLHPSFFNNPPHPKTLIFPNYTILIDFPSKQTHSFFHILNSIEQTINNYYCFPGTKGENSDKKGE